MSSEEAKFKATSLVYSNFGAPSQVISIKEHEIVGPKTGEVLIQVLASPIHPVDILTIRNEYPIVPTEFPATGGSECVGEVVKVGAEVTQFNIGDRVIVPFPAPTNIGTWTTLANYPENCIISFPNDISIPQAATFSLNPPTAYVMLKEFINLEPGDTVILNAANSAVGQIIHQLCKKWGINSIGIIRKRSDQKKYDELCTYLKNLGAKEIITPKELQSTDIFESKYKKPKLALNAVGGKTTELMAGLLQKEGVLVTYGAMTEYSVSGESFRFIVNDISFRGFWITDWLKKSEQKVKTKMYTELLKMVSSGELVPPIHEMVKIDDYKRALSSTMKGYTGQKFIFDFRK